MNAWSGEKQTIRKVLLNGEWRVYTEIVETGHKNSKPAIDTDRIFLGTTKLENISIKCL